MVGTPHNEEDNVRFSVLIGFVSLLAGCATVENYNNILDTWIDADIDELVLAWGIPDKEWTLGGGDKMYTYNNTRNETTGGIPYTTKSTTYGTGRNGIPQGQILTTLTTQYSPTYNITKYCFTTFRVHQRRIVQWSHKGNDCIALPPETIKNSDPLPRNNEASGANDKLPVFD